MKRHDLLPTEFISAGTRQMSQTIAYSIDQGETRFKRFASGSKFAATFAVPSSSKLE